MIFIVDFDNTLALGSSNNILDRIPNTTLINKLNGLHDDGHTIIVQTARGQLSCSSFKEADAKYRTIIESFLQRYNLKYTELTFNKRLADYYIDDLAIHPNDFNYTKLAGGTSANIIQMNDEVVKTHPSVKYEFLWYNKVDTIINIPKIISLIGNTLKMSYITKVADVDLTKFIDDVNRLKTIKLDYANDFSSYITNLKSHGVTDYRYIDKLKLLPYNDFKSFCHGDCTIENIIYDGKCNVYIDPIYKSDYYHSWLIDYSKLIYSLYINNMDYSILLLGLSNIEKEMILTLVPSFELRKIKYKTFKESRYLKLINEFINYK